MLDLLAGFIGELRAAGLPVSLSEHMDAARALELIDLGDRDQVRATLAATLVKRADHLAAFYQAFDVFFAVRPAPPAGDDPATESALGAGGESGAGGGGGEGLSAEELHDLLYRALRDDNRAQLRSGARAAVGRYAGMEPGRPVGGTYYLYRTLRYLELDELQRRLVEGQPGRGELAWRLARDEAQGRIELLKREVERAIRERLVDDRGAEALARSLRRPLPEDVDVMHANRDELAALERALRPLSRKLATRLARRRRRRRRGPVDVRATVRQSLSTGGVPLELRFRPPRPAKPEIFVVADVSGSVASFARFTLHLVHAISSQFSRVRSFVFVDGLDEVTSYFEGVDDPADAVRRINAEADVVAFDGHSDYGHALTVFRDRYLDQITRRTTVLILGDARNNYHLARAEVLADVRARARHVYWLNPEPAGYWNSGDSIIGEYASHCDAVVECRTLRQLERFVGDLGA
ncbi:MAG: vWA domain-containing protein [Acidimicrobiales bacterium]